jgi:hypothetical protein
VRLALVLGARSGAAAHVLQRAGEVVAELLELLEAEKARPARRRPRCVRAAAESRCRRVGARRLDVRKALGDYLCELPLQPGHLRLQRAPRGHLIAATELQVAIDQQLLGIAHTQLLR